MLLPAAASSMVGSAGLAGGKGAGSAFLIEAVAIRAAWTDGGASVWLSTGGGVSRALLLALGATMTVTVLTACGLIGAVEPSCAGAAAGGAAAGTGIWTKAAAAGVGAAASL